MVSPTLDCSTGVAPLWEVPSHLRDVSSVLISLSVSHSLSFSWLRGAESSFGNISHQNGRLAPDDGHCVCFIHAWWVAQLSAGATSYGITPLPVVSVLPRLGSPQEKTHAGLHTFAIWYSCVYSDAFTCVYRCERQACELSTDSHRALNCCRILRKTTGCVGVRTAIYSPLALVWFALHTVFVYESSAHWLRRC